MGPVSDIVERLRQGIECGEEGDAEAAMEKAADEIERLRAEVAKLTRLLTGSSQDTALKDLL